MSDGSAAREASRWHRLAAWWDDYWFRPTTATNLGVCRLVFFAVCFYTLFIEGIVRGVVAGGNRPDVFYLPSGVFHYLPRMSADTIAALIPLLQVSLILATIGLLTRLSSIVTAVTAFLLMSQTSMYGKIMYYSLPVIVVPAIFAISRAGDAFSIDAVIRRRWKWWPPGRVAIESPSGEYQWPVQLGCLYAVILFGTCGWAKLIHGGWDWPFSDTLLSLLTADETQHSCRLGNPPRFPSATAWLIQHERLMHVISLCWMLIEMSAPVALIRRPVVRVTMGVLLILSLWSSLMIGRMPLLLLVALVFLAPWDRLGRRWQRWARGG